MPIQATLFDQTVDIATEYLGPTADRFMRRQISTHLGKEPEDLHPQDIAELVDWVKLTFALLTNDRMLIQSFSDQLTALALVHKSDKRAVRHGKK
jgi:hypothetical protein